MCFGESCSGGVLISAERGISQRATCLVFALVVFNRYAEHLRKPVFFVSGGILETAEHNVGVDQLFSCAFYFPQSKFEYRLSKHCPAGSTPPRGHPELKRTRTDTILKIFKKVKFKKMFGRILQTSDIFNNTICSHPQS
jgi:hypothetical protein